MDGHNHNYVRHAIDCLEELEAVLLLAVRRGQMSSEEEADLARRVEELSRAVERADRPH